MTAKKKKNTKKTTKKTTHTAKRTSTSCDGAKACDRPDCVTPMKDEKPARALVWMSKDLICDPRFGTPVVGITLEEAAECCKHLGGRLPANEDFDVFGDRKLYSSKPGVFSWCEPNSRDTNLRAGYLGDNASSSSRRSHSFRDISIGFRCVWETRTAVPPDIEVIPVVSPKKLGYLLKEPLKDQFGFYLRAMTLAEAEKIAKQLGAEVPSRQVYDALGDMKLKSGLWCWSTEKVGANCVLRGGSWYYGGQESLSAAGRSAFAPSYRSFVFGFRPFWTEKSAVPLQYGDSLIEVYEK
jgi:formylglycine-generating enzyme required for sulfatase activity